MGYSSSVRENVKCIRDRVNEISRMIEELLYEREIASMMKLAEKSLSGFLEDEEDLYTLDDLKVRYR